MDRPETGVAATRRKRPREDLSHADIANRQDMAAMVMQRIESKLDDLAKIVGSVGHDERGELIGTGIAGDLGRLKRRVDKRFLVYDGITKYAAGATAATMVLIVVIWWLIRNRVEEVFK